MSVKLNNRRAAILERISDGEIVAGSRKTIEWLKGNQLIGNFNADKKFEVTGYGKFALAEYQKAQVSG